MNSSITPQPQSNPTARNNFLLFLENSLVLVPFLHRPRLSSHPAKPPRTVLESINRFLPIPMASSTYSHGYGSALPTHTTAAAPAWPSTSKPPPPHNRRRRCLCVCLLVTVAVLLALAVTILVLSLTVLRVRDPTTRLASTRLAGVAPRLITFPTPSIQLNVTLLLSVAVHNPNPASFAYSWGHTDLTYRGTQVGSAEIDPGRIPSKGDGEVNLALTVQADRFAADLAQLVADVERGSVPMEASTRIPGRVTILGFIKRHAVAYSDCRFVFGVADMKVRSQECNDRTKL